MKMCERLKDKDVFVNTLAYGDYSRLPAAVAGRQRGQRGVREGRQDRRRVPVALQQHQDARRLRHAARRGAAGEGVRLPGVRVALRRPRNGSAGTLSIRGLKSEDDAAVYKFRKLTKAEYDKLKDVPVEQTSEAVFAFAEGEPRRRQPEHREVRPRQHLRRHTRRRPRPGADEQPGRGDGAGPRHRCCSSTPAKLGAAHRARPRCRSTRRSRSSTLISILDANRGNFVINRKALQDVYVRRGLKRIQGTRDENGKLVEPTLKTEFVNEDKYLPIRRSTSTATPRR